MTDKYEALCDLLIVDAQHHKEVAHDMDTRPQDTVNWHHSVRCSEAAKAIAELLAECDALAAEIKHCYDKQNDKWARKEDNCKKLSWTTISPNS